VLAGMLLSIHAIRECVVIKGGVVAVVRWHLGSVASSLGVSVVIRAGNSWLSFKLVQL